MKKLKFLFTKLSLVSLMLICVFTLAGCKKNNKSNVTMKFTTIKDTILFGEKIDLNVQVEGTDNKSFSWSISDPEVVTISYDNKLSVLQKVSTNTTVTLTATSNADPKVSQSKQITVVAPKIEVTASKSSAKVSETVDLSVEVVGLMNNDYTLKVSNEELAKIENNTLTIISDVAYAKQVKVTATSNVDSSIKGEAVVTVVPKESDIVKMTIEPTSSDQIAKGESITLVVTVTGTENKEYTWSISHPDLLSIDNNVVTVLQEPTLDTIVTLTATSNANSTVSVKKTLKVLAAQQHGRVGELTSEMLAKIGNESITVTGTLVDVYQDFHQSINNSEHTYDMTVQMNKDKWTGTWGIQGRPETKITDSYRKGAVDGIRNQNGVVGHALERVYIDKNNKVAVKQIKDYMSIPSVWEAQHLWNHLGNLQITKFVYDAENEVYEYVFDHENIDDLYFMTYLSFSLTPMLSDTLDKLYLVVEDGEITKLLAQTEVLYYGASQNQDPDAMSYTKIEVTFSNIGTTVVEDPQPYDAPQYADLLETALAKMRDSKNYSFHAVDTSTHAPSTDEGDYELQSTSSSDAKRKSNPFVKVSFKPADYISAVGTVGRYGQVTENAVLYADTTKYSYSMDGRNYVTKYSGLKQNDDNTYDVFEYNSTVKALAGSKKVKGNIFDNLPNFDFSANVFEFVGTGFNGKMTYKFVLKETNITRDIAMEISAYNYAVDAEATTDINVSIEVDSDGNIVNTVYPYSLVFGTYMGFVTTTYSNVGTTKLADDTFDGYVPRVVKTEWKEYTTKYYSPDFSTKTSRDENSEVVLKTIFGEEGYLEVPSISLFIDIIGDNIYGPFYDWKSVGSDSEGNDINHGYMSIKVISTEFDENAKILNYEELMEAFKLALEAEGFILSVANTDMSGGATGQYDRYICFIKNDVQIVITNNHTKYIDIYFYQTGDWTLKR